MKNFISLWKVLLYTFFYVISNSLYGQSEIEEPFEKGLNLRQPPLKVLQAIGVKPGMIIGEIGAGRGRYTVYLAKAVTPNGKIFANDIDEASLSYLKGRCRRLGINNVEVVVGDINDPLLPQGSLDMAIMVLVYHMIDTPDELLKNLKKSLKPDAQLVIIDPIDKHIDAEFGIDRSKPDVKTPTIKERIENSAKVAGYDVIKIETFLPNDYIFILKPKAEIQKKNTGELLRSIILKNGIETTDQELKKIVTDTADYSISEKVFINLGNEFIGSKSYPEAIKVLKMGIELYPKSSKIYGTLGEVYLITAQKEKARECFKLFLEYNTDKNVPFTLDQFDFMYEQVHPSKK